MEVEPNAKSKGLGTAVISAAENWVLENGGIPLATAAGWNVPSGRCLRRVGMKYTYSAMLGWAGDFIVPPQPLGAPLPGYPNWATNTDILEKPN